VQLRDRIYGDVWIDEPVLQDVIASQAVQRLRGVLQHGISALIGITSPVSRFEHSVGVMLLVRRLGGRVEEQVAALLHDVSHTAFSHVIDYVFEGHDDQSFHDEVKADYIAGTDLPGVLAASGYDWRVFLEEAAFSLLEQPAPALCGDRVDYFLRDSVDLGLSTLSACQAALDHLVVHDGRIITDDLETARWMAYAYMAADDKSWADFREVGLYELTARAIKAGLDNGLISRVDFWRTDLAVWKALHASQDPALRRWLDLVRLDTVFVWDEAAPTFVLSTKIRTIDPDVLVDGSPQPLSTLDPAFARYRQEYLARKSGPWPMRVVPPGQTP